MTKEELLKIYLSDDIVENKNYLINVPVEKIKWTDNDNSDLISVIKLAIEGDISRESTNVTARKINQLLNREK
nr:hypothetical protein [uncultured Psychroserpens sp.]